MAFVTRQQPCTYLGWSSRLAGWQWNTQIRFSKVFSRPQPYGESLGIFETRTRHDFYENTEQLAVAVQNQWNKIPLEILLALVESMPHRLEAVRVHRGFKTKYWHIKQSIIIFVNINRYKCSKLKLTYFVHDCSGLIILAYAFFVCCLRDSVWQEKC